MYQVNMARLTHLVSVRLALQVAELARLNQAWGRATASKVDKVDTVE